MSLNIRELVGRLTEDDTMDLAAECLDQLKKDLQIQVIMDTLELDVKDELLSQLEQEQIDRNLPPAA